MNKVYLNVMTKNNQSEVCEKQILGPGGMDILGPGGMDILGPGGMD